MNEITLSEKYEKFTTEKDFDFSKRSTIACGGFAPVAIYPQTVDECKTLLQYLKEDDLPYVVVGNLSNVLPCSGIYNKVVVCTKRLRNMLYEKEVFVEAGITSGAFLRACKIQGLSGGEFLTGIPCTLGGALYMNAGVAGGHIGDIVESVTVVRDGEIVTLQKNECGYAYKKSAFMRSQDCIVGANLRLYKASEKEILEKIRSYAKRRTHLPKGKSMGCVFKNPDGVSAGQLIECAGLKGFRVGGAYISPLHANFILNDGNATTAQIKTLIAIIKNAVFAQYNIRLEEEIRYLE